MIFEAAIALLLEKKFEGKTWLTSESNNNGADIIHFNENIDLLIQVKQSGSKLGINSGQEIIYALPEYSKKYNRIFKPQLITNSFFNQTAIDLAKQNNIELIDREDIEKWIQEFPLNIDEVDNKLKDRISSLN
jgi:restriction system protein